jgi:cysteinyl-tRNA synthetase
MGDSKQPFNTIEKGKVRMYVCGPTVYGPAHIGHARTYIAFDIIRRYLEYAGYKVKLVINITDVHDDIVKTAREENVSIGELSEKYTKLFFEDIKALAIKEASHYPKVSEEIEDIINMVKVLLDKGYAYETEDGVYYNVRKFPNYGKLSGIKLDYAKTGTRVKTDKYDKENPADFALWKKEPEPPHWDSPWGKGRPGWHIECSVMSSKYLGEQIDVHCGAVDLIFPHHENEIAQSEAATGKSPFVRYWLHSGFLTIDGQKMSKSLGNYIEVRKLLEKYDPKVFRFFIARVHYRSRIDFSEKAMEEAKSTLARLNDFLYRLSEVEEEGDGEAARALVEKTRKKFTEAMNDDFNVVLAWRAIFEMENEANKMMAENKLSKTGARIILDFLREVDSIFAVFTFPERHELSEEERQLILERDRLRKEKRFEEADKIREELKKRGIVLIDTPHGTKWRRVKE